MYRFIDSNSHLPFLIFFYRLAPSVARLLLSGLRFLFFGRQHWCDTVLLFSETVYKHLNEEGDYFDLQLVPERYTGYSGPDAHRVWRSIYEENCFGLSELSLMTGKSPAPVSLPDTMIESLHENEQGSDAHCLEKRVYYKVISGASSDSMLCGFLAFYIQYLIGLHASISTHICREYLNQKTGEWVCGTSLVGQRDTQQLLLGAKSNLFH